MWSTMTALPIVTDVIRVDLQQSQGSSEQIMNRLYFQYFGTAPAASDLNTMATAIRSAWGSDISVSCCAQFYLQSVTITDLGAVDGAEGQESSALAGAGAGTPLPPGDCAMMNFHIARRYRGGHPRYYQSGIPETAVDESGTITSVWGTNFKTGFDLFLAAIVLAKWAGATELQHCNVSFYEGFTNVLYPSGRYKAIPTLRTAPHIDPVIGTGLHGKVTHQRRRDQTG